MLHRSCYWTDRLGKIYERSGGTVISSDIPVLVYKASTERRHSIRTDPLVNIVKHSKFTAMEEGTLLHENRIAEVGVSCFHAGSMESAFRRGAAVQKAFLGSQ
jgi:hypothetical protein